MSPCPPYSWIICLAGLQWLLRESLARPKKNPKPSDPNPIDGIQCPNSRYDITPSEAPCLISYRSDLLLRYERDQYNIRQTVFYVVTGHWKYSLYKIFIFFLFILIIIINSSLIVHTQSEWGWKIKPHCPVSLCPNESPSHPPWHVTKPGIEQRTSC